MNKKNNPERLDRWEAQQREGITMELWDNMREDTKTLITLMDPLLRLHGYVLRPRTRQERMPVPESMLASIRWGQFGYAEPVMDKDGKLTSVSFAYKPEDLSGYYDQCKTDFYVMKTITYWVVQSIGPSTLDIVCNDDRDLLSTVVSILFPERFVDYMEIAIDLTRDDETKAYYRNEIEKWRHHAR